MSARTARAWLLEENQPAMRYRTLRELEGRSASDPDCREASRKIPKIGWAADLLARRQPGGWWASEESLYRPKYLSTNWQLLVLADLGLTRSVPAIRSSCELWMRRFTGKYGGLGASTGGAPHHCAAGNQARALLQFGYDEEPRVRRTLDWLVESAHSKGGWSCWGTGRNLDSWEGLSALGAVPRSRRSPAMQACVERGAEFFLERELQRQGDRYAPWYRLHYPVHYYYDLLVGLDLLTGLGYGTDPRLRSALTFLRRKRRPDGRWNLDAVHPDVEGTMADWFQRHPKQRPTPLALETPGEPSKMITFLAQRVLDRVDGILPTG
jgi:hypothetical protein